MTIIRNIIVALSMYSRIPMPVFEWKDNDMKYSLSFIGLVGVIIGLIEYGIVYFGECLGIPVFVKTIIFAVIPLIITGGFHVDGFMDVQDAFNSYKSKEEKLNILKDPHIGAFAVISFAVYGGLYLAASYILLAANDMKYIVITCIGFTLMRAFGGYISLILNHAKKEGMLHEETKKTDVTSKVILLVSIIICLFIIGCISIYAFVSTFFIEVMFVFWFKNKCYKEFGGIGGDAVGYFITVSELIILIISAVLAFAKV